MKNFISTAIPLMILAMNLNLASATPLPDKSSYSKIYSQIQSQPQLRDLYNGIVRHGIAQKCNAIEEKPLQIIQDSIMSDWFFRLSTATKLNLGKMIDSHIGSEAGKSGYCESDTTVDQNSNTRRQLSRQLDTLIVAYADFVPLVDIAKQKPNPVKISSDAHNYIIAISNNSRKFTNTEPWASYVQSFQYQLINESKLYLINLINGQTSPFSDYVSKVFTAKFESDKLKKEELYDK